MTGTQGLVAFIVGPILGVLVAMLLRRTGPFSMLLAALIGEAATVVALQLWSRWVLRPGAHDMNGGLAAVAADVSVGNRLSALGILTLLALTVGGLALMLHRLVVGRAS